MKKKYQFPFLIIMFVLGAAYIYIMNKIETEQYENAPKIRKEYRLNELLVNEISFERNRLYLNDIQYNADGISGYSRVHTNHGLVSLDEIKPPFILGKKEHNDTLILIKGDQKYFMIVSVEQKWAKQ